MFHYFDGTLRFQPSVPSTNVSVDLIRVFFWSCQGRLIFRQVLTENFNLVTSWYAGEQYSGPYSWFLLRGLESVTKIMSTLDEDWNFLASKNIFPDGRRKILLTTENRFWLLRSNFNLSYNRLSFLPYRELLKFRVPFESMAYFLNKYNLSFDEMQIVCC